MSNQMRLELCGAVLRSRAWRSVDGKRPIETGDTWLRVLHKLHVEMGMCTLSAVSSDTTVTTRRLLLPAAVAESGWWQCGQ
jgi:hypothetical protein